MRKTVRPWSFALGHKVRVAIPANFPLIGFSLGTGRGSDMSAIGTVFRWLGWIVLLGFVAGPASLPAQSGDSCVDCHQNAEWLVTKKKLYDYFQNWRASTHAQEDVTCSDCHGGNPDESDMEKAHGTDIQPGDPGQSVRYEAIPATCGGCHDSQYKAYRESAHFKHLAEEKEKQGPNCVTCHGSVNADRVKVGTVEGVCSQCHNEKSGNQPEIPQRAVHQLNDLNMIRGFSRYIVKRSDPADAVKTNKEIDDLLETLFREWHSFDIDNIEAKTAAAMKQVKEKRDTIRKKQ